MFSAGASHLSFQAFRDLRAGVTLSRASVLRPLSDSTRNLMEEQAQALAQVRSFQERARCLDSQSRSPRSIAKGTAKAIAYSLRAACSQRETGESLMRA